MIEKKDIEKIRKDYDIYKPYYENLQKEVFDFLSHLKEESINSIHISNISQRLNNEIKEIESIINNIENRPERYKELKQLTDIKDIAGVRIMCHCQSDRGNLFNILDGKLKQRYINVKGDNKEGIYRAYHFTFAKNFEMEDKAKKLLYCEIQLRTVLGDAWAIQDSKYVYKNKKSKGEPQILSKAISDILHSCESLWDLVKMKSGETDKKEIIQIKEIIKEKIKTTKEEGKKRLKEDLISWFYNHQEKASAKLQSISIHVFMEAKIYLLNSKLNISNTILNDVSRKSQIHTFGWPIAAHIEREEYRPKSYNEGITAEIAIREKDLFEGEGQEKQRFRYDYWSLKQDGSFYLLKSLFEDTRKPNYLFFNTRTIRITELLMYILNLYSKLEVDNNKPIIISIRHGGLKGRIMGAVGNRLIFEQRKSNEYEVNTEIQTSLREIDENMTDVVLKFTTPLFEIFDFFSVNKNIIDDIVSNYRKGIVT